MSLTRPSLLARRRRSEATVLGESGFVLVFVMLAGLILIITAISLVSRTTSSATTAAGESRTQSARMAAETGFNETMAKINNNITVDNNETPIQTAPAPINSYYTIVLPIWPPTLTVNACQATTNDSDYSPVNITIRGKSTFGSSPPYTQEITRTLKVCAPDNDPTHFRVRSFN